MKYPNKTQIKVRVKFRLCISGSEGKISHSDVEVVNKTSINRFQGNGITLKECFFIKGRNALLMHMAKVNFDHLMIQRGTKYEKAHFKKPKQPKHFLMLHKIQDLIEEFSCTEKVRILSWCGNSIN